MLALVIVSFAAFFLLGVPALIERWLAGEIDVDPFVSHHLKLAEVNRGFELMEAQDGIRSVLHFS